MKRIIVVLLAVCSQAANGSISTLSPDKTVSATVSSDNGILSLGVRKSGVTVLEPGTLGLKVDTVNYGEGVTNMSSKHEWSENSSYPWRGVKSIARNHYNGRKVEVSQPAGKWRVELKVFNDGVAFRYCIPGKGTRHIDEYELTTWKIPSGSTIWYHREQKSYEGIHEKKLIDDVNSYPNLCPPVTVKLPDTENLYMSLTEAGAFTFGGAVFDSQGRRTLRARYLDDKGGFDWQGDIYTPWRVVMIGDLNTLINSDIVHNVCPEPDKGLFPDGVNTSWIEPGKCAWSWWSTATPGVCASVPGMEWSKQKTYVDSAAELNCKYYLVDEGWEDSPRGWLKGAGKWAKLRELCDYAAAKGVKILVWRAWQDNVQKNRIGIDTAAKRAAFFDKLVECGAAGAKVDFLESESVRLMTFTRDTLVDAAKRKLLINFHGCAKPRGEMRTYPNEISREGIRGLEFEIWKDHKASHYATLPFTRLLAGHGDFTPTTFREDRMSGTSYSLQLASAVVMSSTVLCWADDPELYKQSKAVDFIKQIPAVWDETLVLPGSEIGGLCAMARRRGNEWYVGIINGDDSNPRSYDLDLSFLGKGKWKMTAYKDRKSSHCDLVKEEGVCSQEDVLPVPMRAKGGFVAVFVVAM